MLSLSPVKLLIVALVAMILLGPDKLPQVARQLGVGWRAVRQFQQRIETELRESMPDLPPTSEIARMARSPLSILNQLADLPTPGSEPAVPDPGADPNGAGNLDARGDSGPWPADRAATQSLTAPHPEPGRIEVTADPSMN
jgi:sec-independent protein translocase protein TatB